VTGGTEGDDVAGAQRGGRHDAIEDERAAVVRPGHRAARDDVALVAEQRGHEHDEGEQQRDAGYEDDDPDRDRARGGVVGGLAAPVGDLLLGGVEARELRAQRVDAAHPLGRRRGVALGPHGVDERDRVLVDIAADRLRDLLDQRRLARVVADQRAQPLGLARQRRARRAPRREELVLAREGEAAGAGLEVEDELLRAVRGGDDLLGVASRARDAAHVADREEQRAEREPDHHRQRPPDQRHARGQARAHVHKSASGPSTSCTFSSSWIGEKGLVM
jgi:hypothetical protein